MNGDFEFGFERSFDLECILGLIAGGKLERERERGRKVLLLHLHVRHEFLFFGFEVFRICVCVGERERERKNDTGVRGEGKLALFCVSDCCWFLPLLWLLW